MSTVRAFKSRNASFEPNPTAEYLAAVEALARLGDAKATAAYAQRMSDEGDRHARERGIVRAKLTERNVGRLLVGIPDELLAVSRSRPRSHPDPATAWHRRMIERSDAEDARRRRLDLISRIANRSGWMDHGELYFKDGEPYSVVGHPYQLDADHFGELAFIARAWGLSLHVSGRSWYYPGRSVKVELHRSE